MKRIVQKESAVLRRVAALVPLDQVGGMRIRKVIADMNESLDACDDGVALAAPQIGYSIRLFVVSGRYFDTQFRERTREEFERGERSANLVCVNPIISRRSAKKADLEEGCLSVRGRYGITKRSEKVTLVAYDETGKRFTRGASGLLAQVFQHEVDHLDGKLFIDHAKDITRT